MRKSRDPSSHAATPTPLFFPEHQNHGLQGWKGFLFGTCWALCLGPLGSMHRARYRQRMRHSGPVVYGAGFCCFRPEVLFGNVEKLQGTTIWEGSRGAKQNNFQIARRRAHCAPLRNRPLPLCRGSPGKSRSRSGTYT